MKEEMTPSNWRLAKKQVQYLNEAAYFETGSMLKDSLSLRNSLLRQALNRCEV